MDAAYVVTFGSPDGRSWTSRPRGPTRIPV